MWVGVFQAPLAQRGERRRRARARPGQEQGAAEQGRLPRHDGKNVVRGRPGQRFGGDEKGGNQDNRTDGAAARGRTPRTEQFHETDFLSAGQNRIADGFVPD